MKNYIVLFGLILFASSCTEDETPLPQVIVCEDDCLFSREGATGIINFSDCYAHWSITLDEDTLVSLLIDPPAEIAVEDARVEVDATFFTNDIPFLLPDPPGPIQYKAQILNYQLLN